MDIIFEGSKIGRSLLWLSIGDIYESDGVKYVVKYVNLYGAPEALVKELHTKLTLDKDG